MGKSKMLPIKFFYIFIKKHLLFICFFTTTYVFLDFLEISGKNFFLSKLIENLTQKTINFKTTMLYSIMIIFCLLIIVGSGFFIRKGYFIYSKIAMKINNYLVQYSLKQSNSFFIDNFAGNLGKKISDVSEGCYKILDRSIPFFSVTLNSLFLTFAFASKNIFLGVGTLIWLFFYFFFIVKFSRKLLKVSKEKSEESSRMNGKIIDCFANIQNVKTFSKERKEKYNINKQGIFVLRKEYKYQIGRGAIDFINFSFFFIYLFMVFYFSSKLYFNNKITMATFIFFTTMSMNIFWWIKYLAQVVVDGIEEYGKISHGLNLLLNPILINNETKNKLSFEVGELNINNLSFSYKNNLPYVFKNLNLNIKPNQKIGIVGYSGAGKSSLVNLLLRFYDPTEGNITIDGYDIKTDITQESLRQNISYIPQETILFHRTIKENILYGKENATEEEIIIACKKACCYEFIMSLENKFDTLVGERGIKLSGGQRQRIAIARAILKNSKILILDEATSALDSITEKEIQSALKILMENKTVIVIAHRLSTLNNMDRIIVLDNGRIIEDDTKEKLLSTNTLFKQMWNMQRDGILELGD